jgi:hypothetical protein
MEADLSEQLSGAPLDLTQEDELVRPGGADAGAQLFLRRGVGSFTMRETS